MTFPDIHANDLAPDEMRRWLPVLLHAIAAKSEQLVIQLPDEVVEAMLYYLENILVEAEREQSLPVDWRIFLGLADETRPIAEWRAMVDNALAPTQPPATDDEARRFHAMDYGPGSAALLIVEERRERRP